MQLTNELGDNDMYVERIDEGVAKCVKHIVKASTDNLTVRDVHHKLLLQTRENTSKVSRSIKRITLYGAKFVTFSLDALQVRFHALRVLHELILSMNEEYMSLLPEAVPFLAELYEDDADDIKDLLRKVFSDVEQIIGEPITNFF